MHWRTLKLEPLKKLEKRRNIWRLTPPPNFECNAEAISKRKSSKTTFAGEREKKRTKTTMTKTLKKHLILQEQVGHAIATYTTKKYRKKWSYRAEHML